MFAGFLISLKRGPCGENTRPIFVLRNMRNSLLVLFGALHLDRVLFAKSLSFDEIIPIDYDTHLPPKPTKGDSNLPVNVSVHLWVIQIRSVDEVDMDFKMDVVVRQMWEDHRLIFPEDRSGGRNKIILDASWGSAIWTPDVWFKNALDTKLQQWILPSVFYWLMRNKTVYFSGRVTLKLSCDMDMEKFPHDSQTCGVSIIALMSPSTEMQLNWYQPEPIRVSRLLNLPQFRIGNLSLSRCDTSVYGESFSCIDASFTLNRRCGFYIINIYIPTVLIVSMSMLTFWIPPEAVPARITLGVTSLLTIITKQYQSTMPNVSYIVALNVWLSSCIAFVFFSLLEYALVISLVKREQKAITPYPAQDETHLNTSATRKSPRSAWSQRNWKLLKYITPRIIDLFSRFLFPICFVIFSIIYANTYG